MNVIAKYLGPLISRKQKAKSVPMFFSGPRTEINCIGSKFHRTFSWVIRIKVYDANDGATGCRREL